MLDKKQIGVIFFFLIWVQNGSENSRGNLQHEHIWPRNCYKHTVQWWFKKLCKGDESLADGDHSGWSSEVDNNRMTAVIKKSWSSYNYLRSCQRTQHWPFYSHSSFEANWKGKKLNKWVPHELTENQKNHHFWSVIFSYSTQQQTISPSDCDMQRKVILYNNQQWPAQWLDQEAAPKHSLKPNLHQEKVSGHWSAAGLIHYSFLNSGETVPSEKYAQQISEMLCKLQRLQPALANRKGPVLHKDVWLHTAQPTLQKLNWATKCWLICHIHLTSHQPTYHFFKHLNNFWQVKRFHNQQEAENAFQEFLKSWSTNFYATTINKLTSQWQKCVDFNSSYFDS